LAIPSFPQAAVDSNRFAIKRAPDAVCNASEQLAASIFTTLLRRTETAAMTDLSPDNIGWLLRDVRAVVSNIDHRRSPPPSTAPAAWWRALSAGNISAPITSSAS
jgi:hypothetical protein